MNNALENYLVQRADQRGEPIKATLELTPLCNLDCRMCYLRHTAAEVREKGGLLPLSFWQGLIPPMKEEAGVLFVALIGGEIFLLPWLEELYCRLHGSGFHLNFTTNATLLADGVPPWLAERKPRYATVSLYGASDETYQRLTGNPRGFTQAAAGLENLLRAGIATKLNVLVTPENVGDMGEIVRIARENGLPVMATAYSFPNGVRNSCGGSPRLAPEEAARTEIELRRLTRTEEEFRDWLAYLRWEAEPDAEHYRHMTCRAASSTLWINWRGRMAACGMMEEPAVDLRQGNPFAEAWQLLRKRTRAVELPEACAACRHRHVCSVCAAMIFSETGGFSGVPRYICRYTEELIRLAREMS